MKKYRLFMDPVAGRTKFLNEIAKKGYRLTNAGALLHEFQSTSEPMEYFVQYIGYLSNDERESQEKELEKKGFDVFYVPLNVKKYSFWATQANRVRDPEGYLQTSFGMVNRELRILGKKEASLKFPMTDPKRATESLNAQRRANIVLILTSIFLILFPFFAKNVIVPSRAWALYFFGGIFFLLSIYKFYTVSRIAAPETKK